ncbi:protein hunchback [Contarinia nasturtii]|uniref:protein hunchback n=1 Tax=Contarinia nasturtii TaxID=265458 RepID=UPI0012D4BBCC|nr:protein hunchback [Contarinia nasturtii]
MHSWDIMPQSANYDQGWCGTTTNAANVHIKAEPPNIEATFDSIDIKSNNNNNNTMMLSATGSRNSESNPTSPHSVVSDESVVNHPNLYYNDTLHSLINGNNTQRPLGFNPLTPPGYPNACLRSTTDVNMQETLLPTTPSRRFAKTESAFNSSSLTPIHTPPMDQTPPKSPKFNSDISEKDGTDIENGSISGDDSKSFYGDFNQEIALPKVNSHGKVKTHKCKHCAYIGVTKKDFWEHQRQHIKPERQISCPKCPFVTEFKHHFEYHVRNHDGDKPFKCPECAYSCVNKSMLNSHLKSHSDVYQYRCENCNYATKYVHSLKLHLRKYDHHPAVPLDPEGIPDAAPIIDVYGTRRGPKKRSVKTPGKREQKKQNKILKAKENSSKLIPQSHSNQSTQQTTSQPPSALSNLGMTLPPFLPSHIANMLPYFNLQMLVQQQQLAAQLSPNQFRNGGHNFEDDDDEDVNMVNEPLGRLNDLKHELDISHPESPTSSVPNSNPSLNSSHMSKSGDDDNHSSPMDCHAPKSTNNLTPGRCSETDKSPDNGTTASSSSSTPKMFDCKYCLISFQDAVLHTIHMGYHGYNDVFTCNMCGEKCSDRISFFLHIAKNQHS